MPSLKVAINAAGATTGALQFSKSADRVKRSARDMSSRLRDANGRFLKTGQAADKSGRRVGALGDRMDRTGGVVKRFTGLLGGLGLAFTSAFAIRHAIGVMVDFEATMAELQGVTSATADVMESFTETARELGATTRFSATQAGEGLLFLARAGFSAKEAIAAVPATLNLATAGTLDLGEAADIASNVVQQFGLAAQETERVVDTLVNTANSANTDVRQLSEAMKFVGPVAGAMGRAVEETAAAIGALSDAGIQASLAGTGMRQVYAALLGPTAGATARLTEMGLTLEDVNPEANSLADIFERLKEGGLTSADAMEIFGRRAAPAALIMRDSADKMRDLAAANEAAAGTAERNANIMQDTLRGSLLNLKSATEELILTTGDGGLAGSFRTLVDLATDVIRVLGGVGDEIAGSESLARGFLSVVKSLTTALITMTAIKTVLFFTTMASAIREATAAMIGLRAATIGHPILLIGTIIAAAALAFDQFTGSVIESRKEIDRIRKAVEDLDAAAQGFGSVADQLDRASVSFQRALSIGETDQARQALIQRKNALEELSIQMRQFKDEADRAVAAGADPIGIPKEMLRAMEKAGVDLNKFGQAFGPGPISADNIVFPAAQSNDSINRGVSEVEKLITDTAGRLEQVGEQGASMFQINTELQRLRQESMGVNTPHAADRISKEIDALLTRRDRLTGQGGQPSFANAPELGNVPDYATLLNDIMRDVGTAQPFPQESPVAASAGAGASFTAAESVGVTGRFLGLASQFESQRQPMENTAHNTRETADTVKEMLAELRVLTSKMGSGGSRATSVPI